MTDESIAPDSTRGPVLHICSQDDWKQAQIDGQIVHSSLAEEGFMHCSFADQVLIPADERFKGRKDLLLLTVDISKLDCPLVVEDSYNSGQKFPHIYGVLPVQAILRTTEFPCDPNGHFQLPEDLVHD